jgi:predicted metal-binding membrane protein
MIFERISHPVFFTTSALLFAGSAGLMITWWSSMSDIGSMAMPGGWTMSMAWMPMLGQTWLGAATSFVSMWVMMMVAMMLPSLVPTLRRYLPTTSDLGKTRMNSALVGAGYFAVWSVFGIVIFPLGAALVAIEMRHPGLARVVPLAMGAVVVMAGTLQFSAWKAHHLARCREPFEYGLPANASIAWRQGLRFGLHCTFSCVGFTAMLVALGVMDLWVMGLVAAAITAERLAPNGGRVARVIGIVVIGAGLLLVARAAGCG